MNLLSYKKNKAQVAIEFMIIISAVVFFVSLLLLAIQNKEESTTYQHQIIQIKEIALTVQNEINLASESSEGYSREFEIPQTAGNQEYEITLDSGVVYIKTTNNKHALTLPVKEVTGNVDKGINKIKKINGDIIISQ
jgi:uncharacterized protein (UPF0333 family)